MFKDSIYAKRTFRDTPGNRKSKFRDSTPPPPTTTTTTTTTSIAWKCMAGV